MKAVISTFICSLLILSILFSCNYSTKQPAETASNNNTDTTLSIPFSSFNSQVSLETTQNQDEVIAILGYGYDSYFNQTSSQELLNEAQYLNRTKYTGTIPIKNSYRYIISEQDFNELESLKLNIKLSLGMFNTDLYYKMSSSYSSSSKELYMYCYFRTYDSSISFKKKVAVDDFKNSVNTPTFRPEDFMNQYGNSYIDNIVKGREIVLLIHSTFNSLESKKKVLATLSANYIGSSAEASFIKDVKTLSTTSILNIDCYQLGRSEKYAFGSNIDSALSYFKSYSTDNSIKPSIIQINYMSPLKIPVIGPKIRERNLINDTLGYFVTALKEVYDIYNTTCYEYNNCRQVIDGEMSRYICPELIRYIKTYSLRINSKQGELQNIIHNTKANMKPYWRDLANFDFYHLRFDWGDINRKTCFADTSHRFNTKSTIEEKMRKYGITNN